ncbi:hypothetical protein LNTAR_06604 [Lentisphaera araneosa HTCC2155]|jgi:hypothetical protein|uniref:Heme NO-binding domain-containing protein n=1 Tax=Lentisphaera araneosa HTCC2155 TaxID=313628 RepID=A6DNE7_9BACT|nr:heme NO-binding domain-containing protein [Lentisphaera araneosa]EDM26895.1 hypothetical protein LNTAR_06604 [Lentisphaera araneosa HTCC2155]
MYGIINRFFKDFFQQNFGEDEWSKIAKILDIEKLYFMGMKQYPDQITYGIVSVASEKLEIDQEKILYLAGTKWVDFILETEFNYVFKVFGDNLFDFMKNLDNLHFNVTNVIPGIKPPSFKCTNVTQDTLYLHYYSDRPGLDSFVEGLIMGLATFFNKKISITLQNSKDENNDHSIFFVVILGDRT